MRLYLPPPSPPVNTKTLTSSQEEEEEKEERQGSLLSVRGTINKINKITCGDQTIGWWVPGRTTSNTFLLDKNIENTEMIVGMK